MIIIQANVIKRTLKCFFSWKMEQFSKLLHSLFCDYMTHSFTIMYCESDSERDSHSGTELHTIHCFYFLRLRYQNKINSTFCAFLIASYISYVVLKTYLCIFWSCIVSWNFLELSKGKVRSLKSRRMQIPQ